jgi:hypothetical protein
LYTWIEILIFLKQLDIGFEGFIDINRTQGLWIFLLASHGLYLSGWAFTHSKFFEMKALFIELRAMFLE